MSNEYRLFVSYMYNLIMAKIVNPCTFFELFIQRSLGAVEEHQRMRNYLLRIEREGVQKVKMFVVITAAYVIFWGPLFFVTLVQHPLSGNHSDYEVNT